MQTEGLGLNAANDSSTVDKKDSAEVDTSSGNIEKMKNYLDSLNKAVKTDTTSTPKVTIKPGN